MSSNIDKNSDSSNICTQYNISFKINEKNIPNTRHKCINKTKREQTNDSKYYTYTKEFDCLINTVVNRLINVIKEIETKEDIKAISSNQNERQFSSYTIPDINLSDYVKRLVLLGKLQSSTFILACIYLDRYCTTSELLISKNNIYR